MRTCTPNIADTFLLREVLRQSPQLACDLWTPGRIFEVEVLLAEHPLTVTNLAATFGPGWRGVVTVIRQAAVMPTTRQDALEERWLGNWRQTPAHSPDAWRTAVLAASDKVAWYRAAWHAARDAAPGVQRIAAWHAAVAATVRHVCIDAEPELRERFELAMTPWRDTVGDPFKAHVQLR